MTLAYRRRQENRQDTGFLWRTLARLDDEELLAHNGADRESSSRWRLMSALPDTFLQLINGLERDPAFMQFWEEQVHSAFVYAGDDSEILRKLMRRLTGDDGVVISKINPAVRDLTVSNQLDDVCGVMSGVRATATGINGDADVVLNTAKGNAVSIISVDHGAAFLRIEYNGVAVFLSTSKKIIDIDAELTSQNFDVRDHFLSAVPLVLYIKWAFGTPAGTRPETNACLVIDDPVLKPDSWLCQLSRASVSDEAAQVLHEHRIHPLELAKKRSTRLFGCLKKTPKITQFRFTVAIIPGQNLAALTGGAFIGRLGKRSTE